MSRPRYQKNQITALEKINRAFWDCLEKYNYEDITIKAISKAANINHNTIYYYYKSIDDLATQAFHENAEALYKEIIIFDSNGLSSLRNIDVTESIEEIWKKITLFAGSQSYYLRKLLFDSMKTQWLRSLKVTYEKLETTDKAKVDFLIGGLVVVISRSVEVNNIKIIDFLSRSDLGDSFVNFSSYLNKKYSF